MWSGRYKKNLCDNYFMKLIIYLEGIRFVYTPALRWELRTNGRYV